VPDIFACKYVLIPIHLGQHWCCAVINFHLRRIEYYDSLLSVNSDCMTLLRGYLTMEHEDLKKSPFDFTGWTDYSPTVCTPCLFSFQIAFMKLCSFLRLLLPFTCPRYASGCFTLASRISLLRPTPLTAACSLACSPTSFPAVSQSDMALSRPAAKSADPVFLPIAEKPFAFSQADMPTIRQQLETDCTKLTSTHTRARVHTHTHTHTQAGRHTFRGNPFHIHRPVAE